MSDFALSTSLNNTDITQGGARFQDPHSFAFVPSHHLSIVQLPCCASELLIPKSTRPTKYSPLRSRGIHSSSSGHMRSRGIEGKGSDSGVAGGLAEEEDNDDNSLNAGLKSRYSLGMANHCGRISSVLQKNSRLGISKGILRHKKRDALYGFAFVFICAIHVNIMAILRRSVHKQEDTAFFQVGGDSRLLLRDQSR